MALPENWQDDIGMKPNAAFLNQVGAEVNANTNARPSSGPYASLPAPGKVGALYLCTDVGLLLRDNGTSWDRWGGALHPFVPVPTSGWSDVNLGPATVTADKDALLMTVPPGASTFNWRMRVRTLTPASNYTATFYLEPLFMPATSYWRAGIVLRNSTSGLFTDFDVCYDGSIGYFLSAAMWSSPTTFGAGYSIKVMPELPKWLRIRDDNTTRFYEFSYNGIDWLTFHSVARTNYVTPNQIGIGAFNDGTGRTGYLRLRSLTGVS